MIRKLTPASIFSFAKRRSLARSSASGWTSGKQAPPIEVVALLDQRRELGRVVEAAGMRLPFALAPRRISAQGEHVLDARGGDSSRISRRRSTGSPTRLRCAIASIPAPA